jgi:hypothetical protein
MSNGAARRLKRDPCAVTPMLGRLEWHLRACFQLIAPGESKTNRTACNNGSSTFERLATDLKHRSLHQLGAAPDCRTVRDVLTLLE